MGITEKPRYRFLNRSSTLLRMYSMNDVLNEHFEAWFKSPSFGYFNSNDIRFSLICQLDCFDI